MLDFLHKFYIKGFFIPWLAAAFAELEPVGENLVFAVILLKIC
jgi:hypothetical protein